MPEPTISLVQSFQAKYESLAGKVLVVHSSEELVQALFQIVQEKEARRVATADLPGPLLQALKDLGVGRQVEILSPPYPRNQLPQAINEAKIGISFVEFAIAETGTIVECATNDETRLVSSLPDVHVAILTSEQIVETLDEAAPVMRAFFEVQEKGATITFISGPSRTGDIEMRLTLGVHGPKESYVVVIEEQDI